MMKKPQYVVKLSLKQLALRKIAVCLWNQDDILPLIKSFRSLSLTDVDTIRKWQESIESKVKENVPILLLPNSLEEDLLHVIKPIGPEILKWRMLHESVFSNSFTAINILDQLCWTCLGTVDYRKTAEILIRQEQIDLTNSYKLACMYCLYDDIRIIWGKLSKDTGNTCYDEVIPLPFRKRDIVIFWTCLMKGEVAKMDGSLSRPNYRQKSSLYQFAFECAALSGNKVGTEYFFHKLKFEEREASLLKTAKRVVDKRYDDTYSNAYDFPKEKFSDVVCFLLSQMKEEEQVQLFKKLPYRSLRCFMDWPWQELFMKVAGLMWNFLPVDNYYSTIRILTQNRTMTGYNYLKQFGEFFVHAPSVCRKYIIDKHCENGIWFRDLFYANNTEIIKLVLRNVDNEDRPKFIICNPGCRLCLRLIKEEKWNLLELFVSECKLSSTDKTSLKETFENYIKIFYSYGMKRGSRKVETFFQLIDNGYLLNDNKRITEGAKEQSTSSKPKRKRKQ